MLEKENLQCYEQEATWLNSSCNQLTYYIPGKGITLNEIGEYNYTEIKDINDFVFGQEIEKEFLSPISFLENEEMDTIEKLKTINSHLGAYDLVAVYTRKESSIEKLIFFYRKYPDLFFKIPFPSVSRLTADIIKPYLEKDLETTLEKPFGIDL